MIKILKSKDDVGVVESIKDTFDDSCNREFIFDYSLTCAMLIFQCLYE